MPAWNSQRFLEAGRLAGIEQAILDNAVEIAERTLREPRPGPPILTLGHLAHLTDIDVRYLRELVARDDKDRYREFTIRKKPVAGQKNRLRFIAVPEPKLMALQRWIARSILAPAPVHPASVAYAPDSQIVKAARRHVQAQWLIKVDVRDFFESITEIDVYRVFLKRGYQPLTALELARICTRLRDDQRSPRYVAPEQRRPRAMNVTKALPYLRKVIGYLPQGAPTSPMLANLAISELDVDVQRIADSYGVRYTRYADDLVFSTTAKDFGRQRCSRLIGEIYHALAKRGLSPNTAKTLVAPPGARKVVLGLLVDGRHPALPRNFRSNLRMHMHFITLQGAGPSAHAESRGFSSVEGLRQHLLGLIAFAGQVDQGFANDCRSSMASASWQQP